MTKRILLAGILGGLVLFVWEFVAHMMLPLGEAGIKGLTNETAVIAALKEQVKEDGLYFFPAGGWSSDMTADQKRQAMEKAQAMMANGPGGLLLIHISNRHIDLAPVLGSLARAGQLAAALRHDNPVDRTVFTPSNWVVMARHPATLDKLRALAPQAPWQPLPTSAARPWTDDHASVLPQVRWSSLVNH